MAGARRRAYNKSGNLIMEAGTENMKIAIGNDHTAVGLKTWIKAHLLEAGHEVVDFGTNGEERTDYPVYGYKAAKAVAAGECEPQLRPLRQRFRRLLLQLLPAE